jgi:hypothetical protein
MLWRRDAPTIKLIIELKVLLIRLLKFLMLRVHKECYMKWFLDLCKNITKRSEVPSMENESKKQPRCIACGKWVDQTSAEIVMINKNQDPTKWVCSNCFAKA